MARLVPHFYQPVPADRDEESNVTDEYYSELKWVSSQIDVLRMSFCWTSHYNF